MGNFVILFATGSSLTIKGSNNDRYGKKIKIFDVDTISHILSEYCRYITFLAESDVKKK